MATPSRAAGAPRSGATPGVGNYAGANFEGQLMINFST